MTSSSSFWGGRLAERQLRLVAGVEEGHQPVIIFLRHRVVLVVVALRTADRQAEPDRADGVGAIDRALDAELFGIGAPLLIEGGIALEAGRDQLILCRLRQQIAGELFDGELVERQVAIVRSNDPIAVGPNRPCAVDAVAVRVGVAGQIEPVAGLPFAVVRRREEAIDDRFVGVRRLVPDERGDFSERRQ